MRRRMTMKRVLLLPLLVAALALSVFASTAGGTMPTDPSRSCADIEGGAGFSWDGATLSGSITLLAPACKSVTYTLYVLNQAGGSLIASAAGVPFSGDPTIVQFSTPVTDTDTTVCVYATSSSNGHVFDVGAPEGLPCLDVDQGSAPATKFH
jgi:hypothetical protein